MTRRPVTHERIRDLHERWHRAPLGSKERRHLRRAYERLIKRAQNIYSQEATTR